LGRAEAEREPVETTTMLPAPAQGCVGIEIRSDDDAAREALAALDHADSHICAAAERGFLAALDGSCRTPIAAYATVDGSNIHLRGEVVTPDGAHRWFEETRTTLPDVSPDAAAALGRELGAAVRKAGGAMLERVLTGTQ
jgi:hydroxymethylbilane synthase